MNVAVSDVTMAITGLIRGAGMICTHFVGVDPTTQHVTWFCEIYEILIQVWILHLDTL